MAGGFEIGDLQGAFQPLPFYDSHTPWCPWVGKESPRDRLGVQVEVAAEPQGKVSSGKNRTCSVTYCKKQ